MSNAGAINSSKSIRENFYKALADDGLVDRDEENAIVLAAKTNVVTADELREASSIASEYKLAAERLVSMPLGESGMRFLKTPKEIALINRAFQECLEGKRPQNAGIYDKSGLNSCSVFGRYVERVEVVDQAFKARDSADRILFRLSQGRTAQSWLLNLFT